MNIQTSVGNFVCGVMIGLVLTGGLWLLMLAGQVGRPVPNTQWVEEAFNYKLSLSKAEQRPKVLLVGGSASMFGVNSTALSTALGRPVINLGVNAGVLSPYIQHYARQAIAPGDWVVLPVEYPMFHGRYSINMSFIDYWWGHPGFRHLDVNLAQLAQMFWLTPVTRALEGYRGLPEGFKVSGLYGPQNLDANGDQINNQADRQEIWMRELVERSAVERYGEQAKAWQANWASWKRLADDVTTAGGCAVFVPPPMLDREVYHQGKERRFYESLPQKARAHGLNYVGSPLDTLYPLDHFFDTNYHLNDAARTTYTRYLIDIVKPELASCKAS